MPTKPAHSAGGRAIIGVMTYTFARIGAVVALTVKITSRYLGRFLPRTDGWSGSGQGRALFRKDKRQKLSRFGAAGVL